MDESINFKHFIENAPLYSSITLKNNLKGAFSYILKEIDADCPICDQNKPFHNYTGMISTVVSIGAMDKSHFDNVQFRCVTCVSYVKTFWFNSERTEDNLQVVVTKIGQWPQNKLPSSKVLSKFFKKDKQEYNKAVVCLANGYGVAAYAYLRRIVERNILDLIDLIQDEIDDKSPIFQSLQELKINSPMSDRIKIANKALPEHLKPDGFNPLGQIYGLLSDGVHSLSEEECLKKAEDIQACLEFLISELATHKKNKEEFKKRLNALKSN